MSAVSDVLTYLEGQVNSLLPTAKAMPYMYGLESNDRLGDNAYSITVGGASVVEGTTRAITFDHDFNVSLSRKYLPKKGGDSDLREKINSISSDIETLYKTLARRSGNAGTTLMLLISPVDVSEPAVDNDNNLVTLTLTLTVKYRVAT